MEIEDRVVVATPEGVDIELVVAGLGSRFLSSLVDTGLQLALLALLLLGAAQLGSSVGVAVAGVAFLLVVVVVPTCFDAFGDGRTPGRRLTDLQAVMEDGGAVTLVPAAVRNIVRIIDFLPALYSIGVVAILATPRNQRLGDLAAGTLVVRSARSAAAASVVPGSSRPVPVRSSMSPAPGWDLTAVTREDETLVRSFLARRDGLDPAARARVAATLAGRLEPVVAGPDRTDGDEPFLEAVLAARESRSR